LSNSASGELNGLGLDLSQATVTLNRSNLVDVVNSSVIVDPPLVTADGVDFSTITVTLLDINGDPLAGRMVSIASSRGALDVIIQPASPTDANGVATGQISSLTSGITQVQVTDVAESALLNDQPDVMFTLGEVLLLTKSVRPDRAVVGDIVTYTIEIQNTTSNAVSGVRIADTAAPVLSYVAGTARLDGAAIADPLPGTPMLFDLGDIAALADTNGNGVADPGESGHATLSYAMVVGAGARVGSQSNTAIAVDLCDACAISAPATASLEIGSDPIFDLGTIIGKVYQDLDGDGLQDAGEIGVGGAMVALDNGTYALTDANGRYHFPAVQPGQRMVKLNLATIAGGAHTTEKNRKVLSVTPGLLAKANFGVIIDQDTAAIGRDGEYGVKIDSSAEQLPDKIVGSASDLSLVINGVRVRFADGDVALTNTDANSIIHMGENGEIEPLRFAIDGQLVGQLLDEWGLRIWHSDDDEIKTLSGEGILPGEIPWSDVDEITRLLLPGRVYFYQLEARTEGARTTSRRKMFGVNRETAIALELRGGAFGVNSHDLTSQAKQLLTDAARIMREHPDETISIAGHTDSIGARTDNQNLSERRANAAFAYLVNELQLPATRFVVKGYGEDRPVASNKTDTGRKLNRRVDIHGELTSVERARMYETRTNELMAEMDGWALALDESGQFSKTLDDSNPDSIDLRIVDRLGQSVQAKVELPRLELQVPKDAEYQSFAADDPRRKAPGEEPEGATYAYRISGQTDSGNIVA
ncbi:MAG: OmpA family protein, partial [Gammaproteobacteria bacterium]|nr:OmpA family protein [Gammaproteobacteria bacterium]